jgi:hypothetical protein
MGSVNEALLHGMSRNYADETVWRGRILGFAYAMRATVFELGVWMSLLCIAILISIENLMISLLIVIGVCARTLLGSWNAWQKLKQLEEAMNYMDRSP